MSDAAIQQGSETGKPDARHRKVRTFRDLIAWQRAVELAVLTYEVTKAMPAEERFGLTSQIRRAVVSIASNIAEGHARESRADYLRFLRMARGSLAELSTQLEIAERASLLSVHPQLTDLIAETARILQALIKSLVLSEPKPKDRS
jgi:four helix bundle protein